MPNQWTQAARRAVQTPMNHSAALCAAAGLALVGCASSGPPDLLPTPGAHRTVVVAPEDSFGPVVDAPPSPVMIAASPEPTLASIRPVKPAWWFEGLRLDGSVELRCIEVLAPDLASARSAVTQAAREAFRGEEDLIEIRQLAASPLAHPGGALRYVAYALVAQLGEG